MGRPRKDGTPAKKRNVASIGKLVAELNRVIAELNKTRELVLVYEGEVMELAEIISKAMPQEKIVAPFKPVIPYGQPNAQAEKLADAQADEGEAGKLAEDDNLGPGRWV